MSDGGISAGYGEHASGTGEARYEGHADTSGLQAEPQAVQGMTEEQARDVLNGMVDERVDQRVAPDGLDRIYARMDEMSQQQQGWIGALADAGFAPGDAGDGYDYDDGDEYGDGEGDVLDGLDQVLSEAVDRRMDAAEAAQEAEQLVATRDQEFEELCDRLPMLHDPATSQAIVNRAVELCESWGRPEMIGTPEFVRVILLLAMASQSEPGVLSAPAQTPQAPVGMYAQPGVQLESAAGAGGASQRDLRPPSDQERFVSYLQATQGRRI